MLSTLTILSGLIFCEFRYDWQLPKPLIVFLCGYYAEFGFCTVESFVRYALRFGGFDYVGGSDLVTIGKKFFDNPPRFEKLTFGFTEFPVHNIVYINAALAPPLEPKNRVEFKHNRRACRSEI